jgi:prolyl-tRNA synthetase
MKWTQTFLFTAKEAPADAEIPSHKLLARAGMIKKTAPGIYSYLNLALRTLRKIEAIIRDELDQKGCVEILMPMVHPRELWEETNRWAEMGPGLLKFKNRNNQDFCLGATHEECVTDIARHEVKSYRDLPVNLYQIQTKYRDEIRPRFGLMRGREFIMKDAYSFDKDMAGALKSYDKMYEAYQNIFNRLGVDYRIVKADAGNIGGSQTHEFQVLAQTGEDHLMVCDSCSFAANIEVAPVVAPVVADRKAEFLPKEEFPTPGLKTIDQLAKSLQTSASNLMKTLFFEGADKKPVVVCLRGSDEVNPIKLKNLLGLANPALLLTDEEVFALTTARPGSCGPQGLKADVYVDSSAADMVNFTVGANKDDFHLRNMNFGRDFTVTQFADLRLAREGDQCPECKKGHYKSLRGIEVGHVFYLGNKYSKAMNATYLSPEGKPQLIEMGCYGIGVSRSMQAAIEQNHDADGIVWPYSIAPYHVHLALLDPKNEKLSSFANEIESALSKQGIEVFVDDRDERPGVKFKDADLLGFPIRINLGARGFDNNEVEWVIRKNKTMTKCPPAALIEQVVAAAQALKTTKTSGGAV